MLGRMDASEKWTNHHPPKRDDLPKTFLQIILVAKYVPQTVATKYESRDFLSVGKKYCMLLC